MKRPLSAVALTAMCFLACVSDDQSASLVPARTVETSTAELEAVDLREVGEEDLRAAFPSLPAGSRMWCACLWDDFDSSHGDAFFTPVVVGEHLSQISRVKCEKHFNRRVTCELSVVPTYFVENPRKWFEIDGDLELAEALQIVALFEQGAWKAKESWARSDAERPGRRVFSIRKRKDDYDLQVWWNDCGGCDGYLGVKPVYKRGKMVGLESEGDLPSAACLEPPPKWLTRPEQEPER